jgi:hypothetical protein
MAWTTPKTWEVDVPLSAAQMNTHLRDNLNALKSPPNSSYYTAGSYNTTSTSMVAVDSTNLDLTVVTNGGHVFIIVCMTVCVSGDDYTACADFDYAVDTVESTKIKQLSKKGGNTSDRTPVTLVWKNAALAAGSHVFRLKWKVGGTNPTATIYGILMCVREIS